MPIPYTQPGISWSPVAVVSVGKAGLAGATGATGPAGGSGATGATGAAGANGGPTAHGSCSAAAVTSSSSTPISVTISIPANGFLMITAAGFFQRTTTGGTVPRGEIQIWVDGIQQNFSDTDISNQVATAAACFRVSVSPSGGHTVQLRAVMLTSPDSGGTNLTADLNVSYAAT